MVISNNGSKFIAEARDNKFDIAIVSGDIMLDMNLTVDEMQQLIDYAAKEIEKIRNI